MKFRSEHTFEGITREDYEQLYFDEPFNVALCDAVNLERELISRDVDGSKIARVVRVAPDRQLPGPVAKVLGGAKIEYTEHIDYEFGSFRGVWHTEPSLLKDKVRSSGVFGFEAHGTGVRRWVEGEIKVKIFGVGGVVERLIVSDVERSYDDAATFTRTWLSKKA